MNPDQVRILGHALRGTGPEFDESQSLVDQAVSYSSLDPAVRHLIRGTDENYGVASRHATSTADAVDGFRTSPTIAGVQPGSLSNPGTTGGGHPTAASTTKTSSAGTGSTNTNARPFVYSGVGSSPGAGAAPDSDDGPAFDLGATHQRFLEINEVAEGHNSAREIAIFRLDQAAGLLDDANAAEDRADAQVAAIPSYWAYAREGVVEAAEERANEQREEAVVLITNAGFKPDALVPILDSGQVSGREVMNQFDMGRAQVLLDDADDLDETAGTLQGSPLAFESEQMRLEADRKRREARAILDDVFVTADSRAIVDQFADDMSVFEINALNEFEQAAGSDVAAQVFDSADPLRAIDLLYQGFSVDAAIDHVGNRPSSGLEAMTFGELQAEISKMEAANDTNRYEFDATLRELDRRSGEINGQLYIDIDVEAATIGERFGIDYADGLALVIDARYNAIGGSPEDQHRQAQAMRDDFVALAEARGFAEDEMRLAAIGGSPADQNLQLQAIRQGQAERDVDASADQILSLLGAGATLPEAEWFIGAVGPEMSGFDAASIFNDARNLERSVENADFGDAALVAISAHANGLDTSDISAVANSEPELDLISAFVLSNEANRRDMTIDEMRAYNGLRDSEVFAALDNVTGGDADNRVSIEDLNYAVNHGAEIGLDVEIIAAAQAFLDEPDLMARLDTARDFSENVMEGDGFGRDRLDDGLFSLEDINSFEFKQDVNFVLGDLAGVIDTAHEGGSGDNHLSRKDVQATLDRANEFNLTDAEVNALQTVLDAELYDQNWLERNRDSIAIAAAVVAGTAIFVASGGTGVGLSATLIGAAYATGGAAVVAGGSTLGINAITGEDLTDGVAGNTFKGGLVGGLAAPGLALGGAGWAGAGVLTRTGITVGFAGEGAGLVGAGALDWAIDPLYDGDSIDMDNLNTTADKYSLFLAGGSIAATGSSILGRKIGTSFGDGAAASVPEFTNLGGEFLDDGIAALPINPTIGAPLNPFDDVVPPPGTTFNGTGHRLNDPRYPTSSALDPASYTGAIHRYTGRQVPGVYLGADSATASAVETATAEVAHHVGDISAHVPISTNVQLTNVLDLTDPGVRGQLGVSLDDITGDTYTLTNQLGKWALANGYDGILAPSARLAGGTNLVSFTADLSGELVEDAVGRAAALDALADDAAIGAVTAGEAADAAQQAADRAVVHGDQMVDDLIADIDEAGAGLDALLDEAAELEAAGFAAQADGLLGSGIGLYDNAAAAGDEGLGDAAARVSDAVDTLLEADEAARLAVEVAEARIGEAAIARARADALLASGDEVGAVRAQLLADQARREAVTASEAAFRLEGLVDADVVAIPIEQGRLVSDVNQLIETAAIDIAQASKGVVLDPAQALYGEPSVSELRDVLDGTHEPGSQ